MKASLLAATPLLASMVWTVALIIDGSPLDPPAAFLVAVGLLVMSTVATVGMAVVGGHWAHLLGLGALAITAVVAVSRRIDVVWVVGTVASAVSLIALLSPGLTNSIRKLPAAAGPPRRAVIAPLALLAAPAILGLSGTGAPAWALLVVGLSGPMVAWLYAGVIPGGLLAIRLGWPVLAVGMAPALRIPAGAVSAAFALLVAVTAWHPSVKASYHPPREVGSTFAIPPELSPPEVLEAADLDERGRPR